MIKLLKAVCIVSDLQLDVTSVSEALPALASLWY